MREELDWNKIQKNWKLVFVAEGDYQTNII